MLLTKQQHSGAEGWISLCASGLRHLWEEERMLYRKDKNVHKCSSLCHYSALKLINSYTTISMYLHLCIWLQTNEIIGKIYCMKFIRHIFTVLRRHGYTE